MNSPRRRAREAALKALYQAEIAKTDKNEALNQVLSETVYFPVIEAIAKDYLKNSTAIEVISGKVEEFLLDFTDCLSTYPREIPENIPNQIKLILEKHFPGVTYNKKVSEENQRFYDKVVSKSAKFLPVEKFSKQLIKLISENFFQINSVIEKTAKNWSIDRMANIDRCILRLSVCEFFYFAEIPVNATINEAIELAKKYSDERSYEFVNGILDKVSKENNLNKAEINRSESTEEIVSLTV